MSAGRDGGRPAPDFLRDLFSHVLDSGYAGPAGEPGVRPPWPRRRGLILRWLTLAVIGFLLAVAYRAAVAAEPDRTSAHAGLVDEVKQAQAHTDALQRQSDTLRHEVDAQQRAVLGDASAELRRIHDQEAATGLAAVTGPGVLVRLTDAPAPIDPTTGKASTGEVSRVLDVDLQSVVNGLWAAGAEAVAVNGQRLTATSTIRTAGTAILVDFRPLASPYEVSAIGPAELSERFAAGPAAAAFRGLAEQYALGFSTSAADDLRLPASAGPVLRYAHRPGAPGPSPSGGVK